MTKEKAMYQTWLILEGLSKAERDSIPQDLLDTIKNTMEPDENIKIDFSIPLEKQNLDSKTWDMLDKVVKGSKTNKKTVPTNPRDELEKIKLANIALTNELQQFKDDSKALVEKYKEAYENATKENSNLKNNCEALIESINSIPGFIRKMFLKSEKVKMLCEKK